MTDHPEGHCHVDRHADHTELQSRVGCYLADRIRRLAHLIGLLIAGR